MKERFLRSTDTGDFIRQPNAKWYVKPAVDEVDPRTLVPMQAKIGEYIRGECINPDLSEERLLKINRLNDFWLLRETSRRVGWAG